MPKSKNVHGTCRLCLAPQRLLHSHIVSDFMRKKSGIFVGQKSVTITSIPPHPDFFRKNVQTGFRGVMGWGQCANY